MTLSPTEFLSRHPLPGLADAEFTLSRRTEPLSGNSVVAPRLSDDDELDDEDERERPDEGGEQGVDDVLGELDLVEDVVAGMGLELAGAGAVLELELAAEVFFLRFAVVVSGGTGGGGQRGGSGGARD